MSSTRQRARRSISDPTSRASTTGGLWSSTRSKRLGGPVDPQRADENRGLTGFLTDAGVQPKLQIGAPGDVHEREADRVARRVTSNGFGDEREVMPTQRPSSTLLIQRVCAECEEEEEEKSLQRKESPGASAKTPANLACQVAGLQGRGQALPPSVRTYFEPRIGVDFSKVRIHTGVEASETARSIGALAFTVGRDIVFRGGAYQPESLSGRRLLAHELTHVVQQSGRSPVVQRQQESAETGGPLGGRKPMNRPRCGLTRGMFSIRFALEALRETKGSGEEVTSVRCTSPDTCVVTFKSGLEVTVKELEVRRVKVKVPSKVKSPDEYVCEYAYLCTERGRLMPFLMECEFHPGRP